MLNGVSGCTGAGGLELGLKWTGEFRPVAYIERDPAQLALLIGAIRRGDLDMAPIWTDFTTFDGKPWRGLVDYFAAGIPCQPHSHAGKRRRGADSRNLWPDAKRIITEMEPWIVIIENVEGLYTGESAYGPEIAADLYDMGYVVVIGYKSAAEVGAPHQRMRTFTIGVLPDPDGSRSTSSRQDRGMGWKRQQVPHLADTEGIGHEVVHESGRESVSCGSGAHVVAYADGHGCAGESRDSIPQGCDSDTITPALAEGELADATCERRGEARSDSERSEERSAGSSSVGDADCEGQQDIQGCCADAGKSGDRTPDGPGWWDVEPGMGRVADGVPHRVHRLRGLGNAVVPQVARSIGEEILAIIGAETKEA